mmetsp:Transcript_20763/g.20863  ORF Transcript_20763/g.20863 Transcript_20763/m.20863 type:complete len:290 (+) Transcript_20763:3285-4154(+)
MSGTAGLCIFLAVSGILTSIGWIAYSLKMRSSKYMARNQPVVTSFLLLGSIFSYISILILIDPNTNITCMSHEWSYNIALTLINGPLVMKLCIVHRLNSKPQLAKTLLGVKDNVIKMLFLLVVDIVILLSYMIVDTPKAYSKTTVYSGVYQAVNNVECNTGLHQVLFLVLFGYKCLIFLVGIIEAFYTWSITSETSDTKLFGIAILIGTVSFIGMFAIKLTSNQSVFIRVVFIFGSTFFAVMLIMTSKWFIPSTSSEKASFPSESQRISKPKSVPTGGKTYLPHHPKTP